MSTGLSVIHTTFPDRSEAERVAHLMVDAGLAVCAQVGADLVSFYRWDGRVEKDGEIAVAFKVLDDRRLGKSGIPAARRLASRFADATAEMGDVAGIATGLGWRLLARLVGPAQVETQRCAFIWAVS